MAITMHTNRIKYSLEEYQEILQMRWDSTLLWLGKYDDYGHPKLYFCRPVPKNIWLPGKPRKKYYRALREKLKTRMTKTSKKYSFLTLTYSHKLYSPEEAAAQLKSDIKELLRRIRRKYGTIQYFYIVELTAAGYPHLHMMLDRFIFWKVLKAMWYKITGNSVIDIRSIPSGNAAGYLCKYLGKQSKHSDWQFSFIFKNIDRLWSSSRGFFGAYNKEPSDCILLAMSWSCWRSNQMLCRPDDESSFWYVPYEFAIPFLACDYYIERRREPAGQDFLYKMYEMFPNHLVRECFHVADEKFHV